MFFPEGGVQVHVYGRPVDMRKSFVGLYALTRHTLGQDPLSGDLYVYINRRGNYLKCLYWDRTGFCIWAKKLERGSFITDWRQAIDQRLDITGLKLLLEGIEPGRYRRRYRHRNAGAHDCVVRLSGNDAAAMLVSTSRTAVCEAACSVVWEGCDLGSSSIPIPQPSAAPAAS